MIRREYETETPAMGNSLKEKYIENRKMPRIGKH
jgi:hypothetical protein